METIVEKLMTAGFAKSSSEQYARYVKNLLAKDIPFKATMLKDVDGAMEKVKTYAPNTQVAIVNALYRVASVSGKTYGKIANRYKELADERIKTRPVAETKTEKQEENWIDWDDVLKTRDALPEGIDKVILSLYTMLPPARVKEYATMTLNEGENVYDVAKKQFIIRKHKTAGRTGDVVVDVPDELVAVLTKWLDGRTSGLLLGGLTAPSITKHMYKVFKKHVGPSMLRHSYVNSKYGKVGEDMKKDAKAMRHSVGTQQSVYNV